MFSTVFPEQFIKFGVKPELESAIHARLDQMQTYFVVFSNGGHTWHSYSVICHLRILHIYRQQLSVHPWGSFLSDDVFDTHFSSG